MKRTILLDVDTGVDDSIAILFALRLPQLEVKAITTVSGNVHVDEVTENTKVVLGLIEHKGIRLGKGASASLRRTRFHAPEVHGDEGLGNVRGKYIRYRTRIQTERAVPLLIDIIKKSKTPVSIVATGPLTNIARAIKKDNRTMQRVKEIISMGGSFGHRGNTGPLAEFNYYVDPDAVNVVAQAGIPLTIVPLNVTETVPLSRKDVIAWSRKANSGVSRFIADVTEFYMDFHSRVEGFRGGFMHDPLTIAIAAVPSIVKKRYKKPILIETQGLYTSGTTLTRDAIGNEKNAPVVSVIAEIDHRRFWNLFRKALFATDKH